MAFAHGYLAAPPLDVLPLGHKGVHHEVTFEVDGALGDYRFVIGPLAGFHGFEYVEVGGSYPISSKYGTKLFALPSGQELPDEGVRDWLSAQPSSGVFSEVSSVSIANPLKRILTSYRVADVTSSEVVVEQLAEVRQDSQGREIDSSSSVAAIIGIALVGVVGLALIARRSRKGRGDALRT